MDLNEIAIFVKVVQAKSFNLAAKELGIPNSTVSSKVSTLEARLGVTLIERTTRKLTITDAGEIFYHRCLIGLQSFQEAQDEVQSTQTEPSGNLKITAPTELGIYLLPKIISDFCHQYPKINVEVLLSDRTVDFIDEGVDLAIRAGNLKDSSLIAKKLGTVNFALYARKSYLQSVKPVKTPQDLSEVDCLLFSPLGNEWCLAKGKKEVTLTIKSKVVVNDLSLLKSLTLEGTGISLLPSFICVDEFLEKKLTRVLPDWISNSTPVHFVYPSQKFVKPKVKVFISFASEEIKKNLDSLR